MKEALDAIIQSGGLLGALVVVLLAAIAWLARELIREKDLGREERGQMVEALMETTQAQRSQAEAMKENTRALQDLRMMLAERRG